MVLRLGGQEPWRGIATSVSSVICCAKSCVNRNAKCQQELSTQASRALICSGNCSVTPHSCWWTLPAGVPPPRPPPRESAPVPAAPQGCLSPGSGTVPAPSSHALGQALNRLAGGSVCHPQPQGEAPREKGTVTAGPGGLKGVHTRLIVAGMPRPHPARPPCWGRLYEMWPSRSAALNKNTLQH